MTLLKMSIYGAVIILAIILIRAFTLHKLPKKTFLILWSVALLRLLVPFDISSEYSVYSLVPDEVAGQLSDISESITGQITDALLSERADNAAPDNTTTINNDVLTLEEAIQHLPQSQYKEQESSSSTENEAGQNTDNPIYLPTEDLTTDAIPLPNMEQNPPAEIVDIIIKESTPADWLFDSPIHLIWLIGVLLCTAFFLFFYIRAYIEFSDATPVTDEYAKDFLKHHWTNRVIYLKQSDKISAPLTYGIFHPVILLPKKMDWENHDQLDYVLYHEFTHIRRFDLIPKLLMAAALCFHWFNPFVWAMYYFFNRDIELSCDECVVKYYEENHTKADYARTLINMEEKKSRITPLCNNFSKNAIEERITAIMKLKKATIGMIVVGIVIVATVIITLTTSAKQPEAAVTDVPTATPAPTMVPFKMIDFKSGEFDEKGLAKTLWQRYEEFAEVYNTCINKSMNKDPYTEEDFVELEIDQDKMIFVEQYLPVADSRFPTMQALKDYVETVCTKEGRYFLLSSTFLNMYRPDDGYEWSPKYVEQNGVLYTKPYDMQAPLLYTAGEPTVYRGEVFFYLLEDNRVAMYARNNPTDSIYRTYFKQENGIWYVHDLSLNMHGIPDKESNTLYRFSVPMENLAGVETETNSSVPLWQKIARSAIGMLYGETDAYDVKNCAGPVFRKDTAISNLNIDISSYSTDRKWMELGVFPEEEKSCYYVIYVLSAHTEITSGPGVLVVTVPADQPENYTVLPIGDAGELAPAALWFNNPVKVETNIYFNSGSSGLWCLDTVTMKLNSLSYVNGQMGDHMVFSAENSESIMVYEQMPASGSIPTTNRPDWYSAVSELLHGNTPKDTTELPHNTVVPDYAISALKTQAASYLAQCGLGTEHYANCYAICKTGGYTVYGADISYSDDYNSPTYFTVYHAYKGDQLMEKVIFRHLITFYYTENPSHVWANYINMDDVVTMAKEELEKFCDTKNYSHTYKITSIHMTSFETLEVEFLIPETENFDIFTEATVEFTYDFTTEKWSVSYFREIPPDYLSSYASFPRLAAKDVTITGKDWCLTYINELDLPHFQELANAGGKITAELGDSLLPEENVYYTIALNGIEYFFYREKAPQNNNQAWNLAITSPDYPLSGGAKVGMTVKELLALYPDLAKTELDWDDIVFQALYGPSMFNFRDDQFPEGFLNNYDYAYTAYLEKGYDGLPVCIAFLIKDTAVSAITVYMPTAD